MSISRAVSRLVEARLVWRKRQGAQKLIDAEMDACDLLLLLTEKRIGKERNYAN